MAPTPTYTRLPTSTTDEENSHRNGGRNGGGKRTPVWIRVLWVLQALIAALRFLLVVFALVATLFLVLVAGALVGDIPILSLILIVLVLVFDLWLSGFIIVQVHQQFHAERTRTRTASITLRKEVYKAAIATWLFVSFASVPKDVSQDVGDSYGFDEKQMEEFKKALSDVWIARVVVMVVVMAVFYPPLWVAWKERRAEKMERGGEGGVELDEHRVQLLDRDETDTLDGVIDPDEDVEDARLKR